MSSMQLYAEHLVNLQQVSVFATLPSDSNGSSKVSIDRSTSRFVIHHEGHDNSIILPTATADSKIPSTLPSGRQLSFRFKASSSSIRLQENPRLDSRMAPDLTPGTKILCRHCEAELVGKVSEWKDLPSGGWAEMMDLWHCHKPTDNHANNNASMDGKGYSASNALRPAVGCGLVDVTSFLFHLKDIAGLTVRDNFTGALLASFHVKLESTVS